MVPKKVTFNLVLNSIIIVEKYKKCDITGTIGIDNWLHESNVRRKKEQKERRKRKKEQKELNDIRIIYNNMIYQNFQEKKIYEAQKKKNDVQKRNMYKLYSFIS